MRRSDRAFHRSAIIPGLISGFITLAAGFAGLSWNRHIETIQVSWIILAAGAATIFTGYRLFTAAKAASNESHEINSVSSKLYNVGELLRRIDTRGRDVTLVLLARIMTICTEQLIKVAHDPELFTALVQTSLECLHTAIACGHGADVRNLRVAVLACPPGAGAGGPMAAQDLLYYPGDRELEIERTDEVTDHATILMSRRHPYENGWLRYSDDGLPAGPEGHILPPRDSRVVSYIRVGIPQVGVLLVDSWHTSLSAAERRLTAAFADVLALPRSARPGSAPTVPAQATPGHEFEGAQ